MRGRRSAADRPSYRNTETVAQLGSSVKTIDTYQARVMEQLRLHLRAVLIRYAHQHG